MVRDWTHYRDLYIACHLSVPLVVVAVEFREDDRAAKEMLRVLGNTRERVECFTKAALTPSTSRAKTMVATAITRRGVWYRRIPQKIKGMTQVLSQKQIFGVSLMQRRQPYFNFSGILYATSNH